MQTTFKKADIAVMALLLLCAMLLVALPFLCTRDTEDVQLRVSYRDGRTETFSLATDQTLTLYGEDGHTLRVRIEGGCARVVDSTCPDGICRMGNIRHSGEMLLCQPAGIALTVIKGEGGQADAVLG